MKRAVVWLDKIKEGDLHLVGSKSLNLSKLISIGVPVPTGFVVTASVFDEFLELHPQLKTLAKNFLEHSSIDPNRVNRISTMIKSYSLPENATKALSDAYSRLITIANTRLGKMGYVVIRSSATLEDRPTHSFAGLFLTVLGVKGIDNIIDAIKRCWSSVFNPRVILYSLRMKIPLKNMRIGVIVQSMVDARSAGVMFTANPMIGDTDVMIIESVWGMGISLVSGRTNPDRVFIRKKWPYNIIRKQCGKKALKIIWNSKKGILQEVILPKDEALTISISEDEVRKLASMGRIIERVFNAAQDIEWCIERGSNLLFILQTRTVTSLRV